MKTTNPIPLSLGLIVFILITTTSAFNVDKAPARVLVSQDRSVDDGYTVEIEANGETRKLRLTPLENIWSEYAQSISISRNENGEEVFEMKNIPQDIKVYHDAEVGSVLSLSEGKVDGVIDGEYIIKLENDQHFVIKSSKKSADQFDYLKVLEYRPQMVVKRSSIGRNDSIPVPIPLINRAENRQIKTHNVEVLFVLDTAVTSTIGNDTNCYTYLTIFSNSIKKRFQTIKDPIINIRIIGCVLIRNSASEPFITNNLINSTKVRGNKVLEQFGDWVFNSSKTIPDHDVCYLITGKNLCHDDLGVYDGLSGLAWIAAACYKDATRSYGTAIGEDQGGYYDGCDTATLEIAQNLGALGDGDAGAGTSDCKAEDGYFMGNSGTKNRYIFSSCSARLMSNYLNSPNAICVRNCTTGTTPPGVYTSLQLPGDVLTMKAQCEKMTGLSNATVENVTPEDSLCYILKCRFTINTGTYIMATGKGAAENSLCPSGKRCSDGACV